jgi:hypothetical protein
LHPHVLAFVIGYGVLNGMPSRVAIRAMTPASPARRYQLRLAIGVRESCDFSLVGLGPRLQITQRTGESARLE